VKLFVALVCVSAAWGQAQNTAAPDAAALDQLIAAALKESGAPSVSVAVTEGHKIVYDKAFGAAQAGTRYAVGSISKEFTAASLLWLEERGKLSLDDKVSKYFPELTRANEVTIRQLLSHTSGYEDYAPQDYIIPEWTQATTPQAILNKWAKKPLDFEPGTQWQYSNTNYVIAGLIVEKVSGKKLMEFLGEHIFHPLGMRSVWNSDEAKLTQTDATAYIRNALGPLRAAPKEGRGWMFAAGELAMTAHDLALWDESLIAQKLLQPDSYREMFTEVKLKDGNGTRYGLGVFVADLNGHRDISHSGEVTGFVSDNEVLVDDGVAVAVLTNHMAGGAGGIAQLCASTVVGQKRTAAEDETLAMYRSLQKGELDRSKLAPNLDGYFDTQTVADFKNSLGPLGEPLTFRQTATSLRGGMTFRSFRVVYPTRTLGLTTYTYPDGKLEQFLVDPER